MKIGSVKANLALGSPVLMGKFQFLKPDDVDRTLGEVKAATCLLDLSPCWLIKAGRDDLVKWVGGVVNASL